MDRNLYALQKVLVERMQINRVLQTNKRKMHKTLAIKQMHPSRMNIHVDYSYRSSHVVPELVLIDKLLNIGFGHKPYSLHILCMQHLLD